MGNQTICQHYFQVQEYLLFHRLNLYVGTVTCLKITHSQKLDVTG